MLYKEKNLLRLGIVCLGCLVFFCVSAQYNSLLWKISGNGLKKPSFLYGTIHVNDPRVFRFSTPMELAFQQAKVFAMELDPGRGLGPELILQLMMDESQSLKKLLRPSDYSFLDSILKANTNIGLAMYDRLSPIVLSTLVQQIVSETDTASFVDSPHDFLDIYLYQQAKKRHKKIIGLETVQEQLAALQVLSYSEQADMLHEDLMAMRRNENSLPAMIKLYEAEDLDGLLQESKETKLPEKLYRALVTNRNQRMATRIAAAAAKKNMFIAVGALHLPGDEGIVSLLRKMGFDVVAIKR